MKISRRAVMLGNLGLLAEGTNGSAAQADLATQEGRFRLSAKRTAPPAILPPVSVTRNSQIER